MLLEVEFRRLHIVFQFNRITNWAFTTGRGKLTGFIRREGKFYVWEDLKDRLLLGIESSCLEACIRAVKRRKAYGVFGYWEFGFKEDNLDFLAKMRDIRSVEFWEVKLVDVMGLYELSELREFRVEGKRPAIDFSRLEKLESVVWNYKAKDSGMSTHQSLRKIAVWRYQPRHKSFEGLDLPPKTTRLEFNWASPSSLSGLPVLPRLTHVEFHRCRNLANFEELPRIAPNLKTLLIDACGRASFGKGLVKQFPKAQRFYVNDKLLYQRKKAT